MSRADLTRVSRLRPSARVDRHQRRRHQQRQRQPAACCRTSSIPHVRGSQTPCGPGAFVSPSRLTSAARKRSAGSTLRSARSGGRRAGGRTRIDELYKVVPDIGGCRAEGRFRRTRRPVAVRPHARRRGQRRCARAGAHTAASCSIAASSTTTTWTGRTRRTIAPAPRTTTSMTSTAQFDDNVVVQIKHGPIDFQVREPASPLFGALEHTNEAIELQVTQEYMGQQRHLVFLVPMWKEALDFDLQRDSGRYAGQDARGRQDLSSADGRIRRRRERRPRRQLVGQSPVAGESLWLRPAGVESGPDGAPDRRRVDAADLRQRPEVVRDHQRPCS